MAARDSRSISVRQALLAARAAMFASAIGLTIATLSACTTHETKTSTSEPRAFESAPISITKETVIVDARPAFDYSTAHIPHSVPVSWSDYVEAEPAQRGIIQRDTFAAARRLARAGLSPASRVVVVGRGLQGMGEEGRVAWMLKYLGLPQVQFTSIDAIKPRLTNETEANPPVEAPMWKPVVDESLNATREEVLFAINQQAVVKPVSYKGAPPRLYRLIDARSARAYLGKEGIAAIKTVPNMEAVNIPWKQFFTSEMRVNDQTINGLGHMSFSREDRILVLDEDGIASAAVTLALRAAGFVNAANYSGGLQDLLR